MKNVWKEALKLDEQRQIIGGSEDALTKAIRSGADLRIHTQFRNNEHVDTSSSSGEIIREVAEFRATCLVDDRWTAGWMTLRQPVSLPDEFGPRASMSFFMYNQNGLQAIARPFLDGGTATADLDALLAGERGGEQPFEQHAVDRAHHAIARVEPSF